MNVQRIGILLIAWLPFLAWIIAGFPPAFADVVGTGTSSVEGADHAGGNRRVRVAVTLVDRGRTWWKRPLPSQAVDGMLVSWGISPLREGGEVLSLAASAQCPQDPFCRAWSHAGTRCRDLFMPDHKDWQASYACYAGNRTLLFGEQTQIFRSEIPETAQELQLRFYYRTHRYEQRQWISASSGKTTPALVSLRFWDLRDLDLTVELELIVSREGDVRDLRIATCRLETAQEAVLLEHLQSDNVRYCAIEPEPAN